MRAGSGEGWPPPVSPVLSGRQKLRALTCLLAAPAAVREHTEGGADGASPTFLESSSPTLCRASSCLQARKDKSLE